MPMDFFVIIHSKSNDNKQTHPIVNNKSNLLTNPMDANSE